MVDISASVLAKLQNKAKETGRSYQLCLQLFCQEEFLRRVSLSKYASNLILKGGLFIYTLTGFESRVTVDIDFGIGDIIVPNPETRKIPTQLTGFTQPEIITYSLESTIAEKFDAIITRFEFTSRMKDFYDIYYLAHTFNFEGGKLQEAIFSTLQNRGTNYDIETMKTIEGLSLFNPMNTRWKAFLRRMKTTEPEFNEVLELMQKFLKPVFDARLNEQEFSGQWNCGAMEWD